LRGKKSYVLHYSINIHSLFPDVAVQRCIAMLAK
jgi:hypothetical protein